MSDKFEVVWSNVSSSCTNGIERRKKKKLDSYLIEKTIDFEFITGMCGISETFDVTVSEDVVLR